MIDFELDANNDINFDNFGDIKTSNDIEVSIITALFTDMRVNSQRGHFGLKYDEASKMWLYNQKRITTQTLINLKAEIYRSLKYLENNDYINSLSVDISVEGLNNEIWITIKISKLFGEIIEFTYNL